MRLLAEDLDQAVSRVTLLLTRDEALELAGSLQALAERGAGHEHVPSKDFQKELTVAIYDENSLDLGEWHPRIRTLIQEDR